MKCGKLETAGCGRKEGERKESGKAKGKRRLGVEGEEESNRDMSSQDASR